MINWLEKGTKLTEEYIQKAHEKPGGSNVGKYPSSWDFAGPSGGSPKGSYPIPDIHHAKSALKLAHNAPDPQGIKNAVYRKFPQLKEQDGGKVTYQMGWNFGAFQKGGNVELYNSLNPAEGFLTTNPKEAFGIGSLLSNAILYGAGKFGNKRKGFNLATPEEEAYWKLYNNIPQDLVKPTNVRINADKGDTKSEYVGIPESMKERIAAMADTLNLGKIVRNPESFRTRFPDSPINYLGLKRDYEFAKKVMDNPGKGQQAIEEYSIKGSPINNTGLGALEKFGVVWDKDKKVLKAYDTYDFPKILNFVIPERDRQLKIRDEIPFNPAVGSTLLKDNFKYWDIVK